MSIHKLPDPIKNFMKITKNLLKSIYAYGNI